MRTLHIIMPMAGEGSRFKEAGYNIPKPLIKFQDKELYRHALDSLDFSELNQYSNHINIYIKYTFIVRKEFITNYNIDKEIRKYYNNANILTVDKTTRGALETLMIAKDYIDDEDYVISIDCDIKFICNSYIKEIYQRLLYDSFIPMVLSFYSKNPIYSYINPINTRYGNYLEEKNPISTYALGGCYCLGTGKNLKLASEQYVNDLESGIIKSKELYLSGVYNYIMNIIKANTEIVDMNMHFDHYWSFGTPYDLEHYNYDRNIWDE